MSRETFITPEQGPTPGPPRALKLASRDVPRTVPTLSSDIDPRADWQADIEGVVCGRYPGRRRPGAKGDATILEQTTLEDRRDGPDLNDRGRWSVPVDDVRRTLTQWAGSAPEARLGGCCPLEEAPG